MDRVVVIGLGNILCGDDAFGVCLAEKLYEKYDFPPNVDIVDGGAQGQTLYQYVERADKLLIFDAVDFGLSPASIIRRERAEIPLWLGAKKITAHQNSFAEILALADLKNVAPAQCVLIGVQATDTTFGTVISQAVDAKIPEAIELGLRCLANWGIAPIPSTRPKKMIADELLESGFYRK
ncbi:MAG: hydrogenase maturation protease [Desulfovibrio sp.]|nr:hydrogenase maturation protease [Desulfovibrio sp.]